MNQVGPEGKGQSVWLEFFLFDVLNQFAGLAEIRNDNPFAARCREQAAQLQKNIHNIHLNISFILNNMLAPHRMSG